MVNVRMRLLAIVLGCVLFALATTSCRRAAHEATTLAQQDVRIISLSPAISRALVDLELQSKIVGRTPHCASLDQAIPAVGDLLNIDYEQIIRLRPTHLLIQPPQAGVDRHLTELAQQNGCEIGQWRLNSIDDIETMVREIPATLFADGSTELLECAQRSADIINRMASALAPGSAPMYSGRTLLVYSVSPVSVFGVGTYLDDILRSLGGSNAVTANGWVTLSLEDVVRLDPQAMIFVKPGSTAGVAIVAGPVWDLETQAMMERRLAVLAHQDCFLPSTSVIEVTEELRTILETFEAEVP